MIPAPDQLGTLDLTLEPDKLDVEGVAEACSRSESDLGWPKIDRIVVRGPQIRELTRDYEPYIPQQRGRSMHQTISALFGIPIIEAPADELTPRERSIRRVLATMPPTREEQVAAELEREERERIEWLDRHRAC